MRRYDSFSDEQLLSLLKAGDEEAFEQLFETYRDKLYSFILHLSGSSEMAGDVLQDVFLKIWRERAAMNNVRNFNAYLFRMVQNRVVNLLLRRNQEARILKELGRQQPDHLNAEELLAGHEIQEILGKAMQMLPQQQRKVFELSRQEGLKYEEIAERLHISPSTVRNHMVHALKSIREFIESTYPQGTLYSLLLISILCW